MRRFTPSVKRLLALAVLVLVVPLLSACTQQRTVAAYCGVVQQHKERYLAAMDRATNAGTLAGVLGAASAIGDLRSMWSELADAAPDDIRTDSETVRDAWDKILDKADDRNWFGAVAVALANAAPMQRVNDYIAKHCGVDAAPVGTIPTSTSPQPSPTATPVSTTSAVIAVPDGDVSRSGFGPRSVITGGPVDAPTFSTAAVVDGSIARATGTVAPTGVGAELTAVVYGAQQQADSEPSFVIASISHTPSSGLQPETWTTDLQRFAAGESAPTTSVAVPQCVKNRCELTGVTLFGDTAVLSVQVGLHEEDVIGTALTGGGGSWVLRNAQPGAGSGSILVLDGLDSFSSDIDSVFGVQADTGERVWSMKGASGVQPLSAELGLVNAAAHDDTALDVRRSSVVDLSSGRTLFARYDISGPNGYGYDPITGRFALSGVTSSRSGRVADHVGLETLDADGRGLLHISHDQYEALGQPRIIGAWNGGVWFAGQNGVDQVDSATGKQLATSPQLTGGADSIQRPLLIVGSVAAVTTNTSADAAASFYFISAAGTPTDDDIAGAQAP